MMNPASSTAHSTTPMVVVDRVVKHFGARLAVNNISFSVDIGDVLGVMGPNGAGKTTAMRMIAGFLRPSAGSISLCGHDVLSSSFAARALLGYLPEGAPLWPDMTPLSLLRFAADVRGLRNHQARHAIARAMELADLDNVADQKIATLSKGYRRRVGLAQAIFHDPPVLVLDEPTDGLDPNQKRHVRDLIGAMSKTKAIIISTHILEEVFPLCSRVLIMDQGRILADETPAQFAARSHYHNAISVAVAAAMANKLCQAAKKLDDIQSHEVIIKKNEAWVTFFPKQGKNSENLAQEIRKLASLSRIPLLGLAVEAGRLDDVFYQMTSPGAAPPAADSPSQVSSGAS